MISTTTRLDLTEAQDARARATLASVSGEYQAALAWILSAIVPHLLGRFGRLCREVHPNILSPGCGNGRFELELTRLFLEHGVAGPHWMMLDPDPKQIACLHRNITGSGLEARAMFTVEQARIEDLHLDAIFLMALLVNMMNAIQDRPALLKLVASKLGPGGFGMILHQTETGIYDIQQRFLGRVKGRSIAELLSAQQICAMLSDLGLPFRFVELPANVNVSTCVDPDNEHGRDLLHCFLGAPLELLDPGLVTETREYVLQLCLPEPRDGDGQYLLPHPAGLVLFANNEADLPAAA